IVACGRFDGVECALDVAFALAGFDFELTARQTHSQASISFSSRIAASRLSSSSSRLRLKKRSTPGIFPSTVKWFVSRVPPSTASRSCLPITRITLDRPTNSTWVGGSRSVSSVSTAIVRSEKGIGNETCHVAWVSSCTSKESTTLIGSARVPGSAINSQTCSGGASISMVRSTRTVMVRLRPRPVKVRRPRGFDIVLGSAGLTEGNAPRRGFGSDTLCDLDPVRLLGKPWEANPDLLCAESELVGDVFRAEVALPPGDAVVEIGEDPPILVAVIRHWQS